MRTFARKENHFFDPEDINQLDAMLAQAWNLVKTSGDIPCTPEEAARTELAENIIAVSQTGDLSPLRVLSLAVDRFRTQRARAASVNSQRRKSKSRLQSNGG